ncbi:MAG: hypothetical protein UY96_C0017G0067 [Parcubacteria group bacterium GW2011_GWB1_56_8]|nr:MAG: hypothetical protein UY96_C0017G0067 [Parcubacteria group bacterium GW2011_GWB1_56_8]
MQLRTPGVMPKHCLRCRAQYSVLNSLCYNCKTQFSTCHLCGQRDALADGKCLRCGQVTAPQVVTTPAGSACGSCGAGPLHPNGVCQKCLAYHCVNCKAVVATNSGGMTLIEFQICPTCRRPVCYSCHDFDARCPECVKSEKKIDSFAEQNMITEQMFRAMEKRGR